MAAEDIEKKVRKMSSQKPESGKDLQQLQEAQNQIVQINAERQGNLQMARLENNANAANNETMSQAVEMASLGGLGGAAVQQQVQAMNPQTQAVLGKYGLGQPRVQRSSSRNVQVTPQKITINNNTTNTTTNNVAVPAANIGGPVQGRTLAIKQDESQARFKTWISNAFAKQNQQAAVREKEYQRREWSLTRSTNKLMKHLSDLGKSVSERLNPQKLASSVGNQFKTILFLFGTTFLAKNWEKVIEYGAKIENFLFGKKGEGINGERGKSGLSKMLISAFGGDPNNEKSTVLNSLKDFFYTEDKNRAGVFDIILEKVKHFFEIRGEAVKLIQPPKIDLKDIGGTLTSMLGYLGDIFKTLIAGPEAAKQSIRGEISRASAEESITNDIGSKGISSTSNHGYHQNATSGAGSLFYKDTRGKDGSRNYLEATDLTADGKLKDKVEASIAQGRDIDRFIKAAKDTGNISVTPVIQGLQRLKDKAEDKGKVAVDKNWIDDKLTSEKKKELEESGDIITRKYKFVIRPKTEDEYKNRDFMSTFALNAMKDKAIGDNSPISKSIAGQALNRDNDLLGNIIGVAKGVDDSVLRWGAGLIGLEELADYGIATREAAQSALLRLLEKDKIIDLIPVDEYKEGLPEGWKYFNMPYFNEGDGSITLSEISPKVLDEITKYLLKDEKATLDSSSPAQVDKFKSYLTDLAKNNNQEIKFSKDYDTVSEKLDKVRDLEKLQKKHEETEAKTYENSNLKKSIDYISGGIDSAKDYLGYGENNYQIRKPEHITNEQRKERAIKIIDFAMNELGMTKEQAAGLAGNLIRESGLVTTAINPSPDAATGLAQWLGPRKRAFEHTLNEKDKRAGWKEYTGPGSGKPLANASFEDQLQYIKWELTEGKHTNGLKKIKESETAEHAAINAFGYYEFSAGPEKAVAAMNKYGQDGEKSLKQGIEFAGDALLTYNSIKDSNNLEDVKVDPTIYMAENTAAPDNYVEEKKPESNYLSQLVLDEKSYNPEFSMPSFNSSPFLASTSFTIPNSATKVPTIDTPMISAKTIGKEITSSNNDSATISDILKTTNLLNDNIKLLQQGQLAQVQATTSIASGLGNMTITVNSGGDKKIPTAGWTKEPYA